MPKKKQVKDNDEYVKIPKSEYQPNLEERVKYYMSIIPRLPENKKKYTRVKIPRFDESYKQKAWEKEEIRRCKEGYNGMSGKMYFYFNYCFILDIERGRLAPDYRVSDAHWFDTLERCQKSREWSVICVKRRRAGFSWKAAADVLHDATFTPFFSIGMNSKSENDSIKLFEKVKFLYDNLPPFLRARTSAGKTKRGMKFAYRRKDDKGNWVTKGTQSEINVVAPVDTAYEGWMLNKLVIDESGKIGNLKQIWAYAEPALMVGARRSGFACLFGTAGDVGKEGAAMREMWNNAEIHKFERYFFGGWQGFIVDEYGNDIIEDAVRWIVYERKRREGLSNKIYNDFIQQYPLTVEEAFAQATDGGLGDIVKINKQMGELSSDPPVKKVGRFRMNTSGEVEFVPDHKGKCIIYEEPKKAMANNYVAGCLPAGEKVLTNSGLKDIEKIDFNDKLVNKEGEYIKIKELQRYEVDESLYEVKVKNTFRTTKFTGEHPLYVSENKKGYTSFKKKKREGLRYSHQKFNFNFKPMKDVKDGEWIKYPNIYKKENKVNHILWKQDWVRVDRLIDSPLEDDNFWWFVGLYLGDGWVNEKNSRISVSCDVNNHTEILDRLSGVIKNVFNRKACIRDNGSCIDLYFSSQQLSNFLLSNFGKYASGKKIPEWVKFLPKKLKLSLFAGYLDSDGCVFKDDKRKTHSIEIVSINLKMLEDLQDILFSIGIISSTSLLRRAKPSSMLGKKIYQKETYRLRTGNYAVGKLIGLGCNSIKLNSVSGFRETRDNRMGCFFSDDYEYIYFQIIDIKQSHFKGTVYNFHCDTNNYVCHHISTHNCDPVDHDKTAADASSQAMFILEKQSGPISPHVVFEYCDKPDIAKDFYQQAAYASMYYNHTKILVENNRYGMIQFFKDEGLARLLAMTPQGVMRLVKGRVNTFGVRMTTAAKDYMEDLIEEYIWDYCDLIPSKELLQDFIDYGARNTDRAMAFGIALMQLKEDTSKKKRAERFSTKIPNFGYKNINGRIVKYVK